MKCSTPVKPGSKVLCWPSTQRIFELMGKRALNMDDTGPHLFCAEHVAACCFLPIAAELGMNPLRVWL